MSPKRWNWELYLIAETDHVIQPRQKVEEKSNTKTNLRFLLDFFQVLVHFSDVLLNVLAELGDVLVTISKSLVDCIQRIVNAWSQSLRTEQWLKMTSANLVNNISQHLQATFKEKRWWGRSKSFKRQFKWSVGRKNGRHSQANLLIHCRFKNINSSE